MIYAKNVSIHYDFKINLGIQSVKF
jgi:hypothetical protein